jgi:pimeloyl-ACP methyl ester carboxylesterase
MAGAAQSLLGSVIPPPTRFAVAGLSMGGYVALASAGLQPSRLAGLALVNTQSKADSAEVRKRREGQIEAVGASGSLRSVLVAQAGLLLHPRHLPPDVPAAVAALEEEEGRAPTARDSPFEGFVRGALSCGARAFVQQQRCIMSREDTSAALGLLRDRGVPMLALTGTHDALIPHKVCRDLWEAMGQCGGGGAVVVEECGHLSPLECPEAVAAALAEWIARVDAAEARRERASP